MGWIKAAIVQLAPSAALRGWLRSAPSHRFSASGRAGQCATCGKLYIHGKNGPCTGFRVELLELA